MFELDSRAVRALGDESYFDFRLQVRVVLPIGRDVPGEHQAGGRLPREDGTPVTRASIVAALVPAAADARLDHCVDRRGLADLVDRQRPPLAHLLGEHPPRHRRRSFDGYDLAYAVHVVGTRHRLLPHHRLLSLAASRSAACWNAASASFQKWSSHLRRASTPRPSTAYTRRVPSGRSTTSRAALSTFRCCDTAGRLTSMPAAISPTESARRRRRLKTCRRVGSARASRARSA